MANPNEQLSKQPQEVQTQEPKPVEALGAVAVVDAQERQRIAGEIDGTFGGFRPTDSESLTGGKSTDALSRIAESAPLSQRDQLLKEGFSEAEADQMIQAEQGQETAPVEDISESVIDVDERDQRMEDSEAFVAQEDSVVTEPKAPEAAGVVESETQPEAKVEDKEKVDTTDTVRREIADYLGKYGLKTPGDEGAAANMTATEISAGAISQERAGAVGRFLEQQAQALDDSVSGIEQQRQQAYREHQAGMEKAGYGASPATAENLNATPDSLAQVAGRERMQKQWVKQAEEFDRKIEEAKAEAQRLRDLSAQTEELTKATGPLKIEKPKAEDSSGKEVSDTETKNPKSEGEKTEDEVAEEEDHQSEDNERASEALAFDEKDLEKMEIPQLQKEMQRTNEFIAFAETVQMELSTELSVNQAQQESLEQQLDWWQSVSTEGFGTGTRKFQEMVQKKIQEINDQLAELKSDQAEIENDVEAVTEVINGAKEYRDQIVVQIEKKIAEQKESKTAETIGIPEAILQAIGNNPNLLRKFQQKRKRKGMSASLLEFFLSLSTSRKE